MTFEGAAAEEDDEDAAAVPEQSSPDGAVGPTSSGGESLAHDEAEDSRSNDDNDGDEEEEEARPGAGDAVNVDNDERSRQQGRGLCKIPLWCRVRCTAERFMIYGGLFVIALGFGFGVAVGVKTDRQQQQEQESYSAVAGVSSESESSALAGTEVEAQDQEHNSRLRGAARHCRSDHKCRLVPGYCLISGVFAADVSACDCISVSVESLESLTVLECFVDDGGGDVINSLYEEGALCDGDNPCKPFEAVCKGGECSRETREMIS